MSGIAGKQLEDDSIVGAKINSAAAIAESKLALDFDTHDNANDPTSGQKAALPGTSGTPGSSNKYVTNADSRNTNDRDPTSHAFAGADHSASNLAAVNGKISDATLIDTNDSRLSNDRDPTSHAFAGADHSASTLAAVNGKVSDATLIDTGDSRIPIQGENDALVGTTGTPSTSNKYVTDIDSRMSNARAPLAHALGGASHNADSLAALNTKITNATLIDTGDSRLSDSRTPTSHAIAGSLHSSSTLASLNGKISNATLIDTNDSRLSNARTPTSHAIAGSLHSSSTLASLNSKISNADLLAEIFVAEVHLGTVTVGSPVATVVFTAGIDSTYLFYEIRFWCIPVNNNVQFQMRTDASGGSSFDTGGSDYRWGLWNVRTNGSSFGQADNADSLIRLLLGAGNAAGEGVAGTIRLYDPSSTSMQKLITSEIAYERENGIANAARGISQRQSTAIINAVQFFFSGGNIGSGAFHLYGIR